MRTTWYIPLYIPLRTEIIIKKLELFSVVVVYDPESVVMIIWNESISNYVDGFL